MRRALIFAAMAVAATAGAAAGAESPKSPDGDESPRRLAVGTSGFFQPSLLMQGWFLVDRSTDTTSTFRVRRAEIGLKGEVVPGLVGYGLMIDPSRVLELQDETVDVTGQEPPPAQPGSVTVKQPVGPASVFQDFFVTVTTPRVDATVGQIKIPLSLEGFGSSTKLLFPERALVAKEFGDKRDIGVRLSKTFRRVGYSAGLFNGTGPNALDTDNDKDAALRVEGYPVDGLVIAGVVYATIGERRSNVKDRYEGDVRFQRGPLVVQAEYIRAHDVGDAAPATDSQGFYAAVAWTFLDVLQPCVRVGYLDPDVGADVDPTAADGKDEVWHLDAGLNYYVRRNELKLQLGYSRFQYDTRTANDEVILVGQVYF